ncbi:T9SS type A sorting domain-containing protein [Aquimarina sp. SS2-1]|uniref:T9SS type A sorting domain-containing protein n=1 Tax=Aquimarina besae TaxID=3342247 RepID=UPI00366DE3A4
MKKLILFGCISISLIAPHTSAQETLITDCQKQIDNAVYYFSNIDKIDPDTIEDIATLTKNCIENNDPPTLFVKGMLYGNSTSIERQKEGFRLITLSSQKGYTEATYTLGLLYKKGIGCQLDFKKAYYWFEQAAQLGHQKAAFNLGYMYFKGLGTVDQDYQKAITWFKQSNYQLAKHWLAICYKNGYGIKKDTVKATSLLSENYISNSKTLLSQINKKEISKSPVEESNSQDSKNNNSQKDMDFSDIEQSQNVLNLNQHNISGNYKGELVQYDWSGKTIKRSIPISLSLDYSSYEDELAYQLTYDKQQFNGIASFYENNIIFDNLSLVVNKLWEEMDDPLEDSLHLEIVSASLMKKTEINTDIIIGNVTTRITEWKEPGLPTKLVLSKASDQTISQEALTALASQHRDFIKLYPVPFKDNLLISYELENSTNTSAEISDFQGNNTIVIRKNDRQSSGEHLLHFNGNSLPKGIYVIRVIAENKQYTKLVIKE